MLYNFISIANGILFFIMSLSHHFGWYDQIRIIMSFGFICMIILGVYFLAKRYNKETKWSLGIVTFGLILDLVGIIYFSGVWQ